MPKTEPNEKIAIVFEDTGGLGFDVYLKGARRDINKVEQQNLTPSEFWASRMFDMIIETIKTRGTVKTAVSSKSSETVQ